MNAVLDERIAAAFNESIGSADVAAARRDMEDAAFRRDRMQVAVQRLGDRLRDVRRHEDQARRRAAYDTAFVERDKLADELAATYPGIAEQLADLVARIAASDAVIEGINRKQLPDGAHRLASAEVVARQLRGGFMDGTAHVPRITEQLRLPAFYYSAHDAYAWPRRER